MPVLGRFSSDLDLGVWLLFLDKVFWGGRASARPISRMGQNRPFRKENIVFFEKNRFLRGLVAFLDRKVGPGGSILAPGGRN